MKPLLLDLFCGAGGCSVGYDRAGFDVVGVDNEPHPDYPFPFHQADAVDLLRGMVTPPADREFQAGNRWFRLSDFAGVVASPPCKVFTNLAALSDNDHPDLLTPTRELLQQWGGLYVIENVVGSPLASASDLFGTHGVMLCGSMFGLGATCRDGQYRYLERHRLFESNVSLSTPGGCRHKGQAVGVYGTGGGGQMNRGYKAHPEEAREAMGIDWMKREDICQAIPPAYTEHIGTQLMEHVTAVEVAA